MTLIYDVKVIPVFNIPLFSKTPERMKKIGGIVPEIFDVVTFIHATHFPPGKGRLSCAATPCCAAHLRSPSTPPSSV